MKSHKLNSDGLWNFIDDNFGNTGGVYKLICMKNEKVIPIDRVIKTDNSGILYIGKAGSFEQRVIYLKKAMLPNFKSKSHICGRRYNLPELKNFREKFKLDDLYVSFISHDNPEAYEKELLNEYLLEFGELPPLNRL